MKVLMLKNPLDKSDQIKKIIGSVNPDCEIIEITEHEMMLEYAREYAPILIIMDIGSNYLLAKTTLLNFRKVYNIDIKILVISEYIMDLIKNICIKMGATVCFDKVFDSEEIISYLEDNLIVEYAE